MFSHIAAACDGTPESRDAVTLAAALAQATGARLTLMHVVSPAMVTIPGVNDLRTQRRRGQRILTRDRERLAPGAATKIVSGPSVSHPLRDAGRRYRVDLMVLGSHRDSVRGHAQGGRHARQLLYGAPFGVAIAARRPSRAAATLARVAVGFDGGAESESALRAAADLATALGAQLIVMQVVEERWLTVDGLAWATAPHDQRSDGTARREAEAALEEHCRELSIEAELRVVGGEPAAQIRILSSEVDLLVVGSRRWGPAARLMAGGVGEALAAGAQCSIIFIPRPSAARQAAPAGRAPRRSPARSSR